MAPEFRKTPEALSLIYLTGRDGRSLPQTQALGPQVARKQDGQIDIGARILRRPLRITASFNRQPDSHLSRPVFGWQDVRDRPSHARRVSVVAQPRATTGAALRRAGCWEFPAGRDKKYKNSLPSTAWQGI
eukprot:gene46596-63123_t